MRKITLILSLMVAFATTAMADLTQRYYMDINFWKNAESYPTYIDGVIDGAKDSNGTAVKGQNGVVQCVNNEITVEAEGNVVVTFKHEGGNHMLCILGVDVIDAEGNVVKSDYHFGTAGGNPVNNSYTLEGLEANTVLTLRSFVYDNTALGDRTNRAQGYYTITNVTGEPIQTVKPAVNLANGVYVIRDARSLDLPFYNGTLIARGDKIGDLTDDAYIFTITKGNDGYYTIQAANGDYVVYTATGGGANVAVKSAAEANDNNKWWAIRQGTDASYRIIVPKTNDVYNAPGWNFSAGLNGAANKALGLWETNDGGSQWYIGKAPYLAEGRMKLKIGNVYAYSNGTNIVKATENNNPLFTFTKGENGYYTIQDATNKYLIYTSTNNHLLTLSEDANDNNKWWIVTSDLQGRDGMLDILPKQDEFNTGTHAFNWSQNYNNTGANTGLGFWGAGNDNSYCELEMVPTEGFYFIKATGTGNNANWYISYQNNKDMWASALADGERLGAKHIWKFEECEDGFKLKSCNLNKYAKLGDASALSGGPSQFEPIFENASKFVFTSAGGDKFSIKDGANNVVRTENGGAVNYWSSETNETWQLVPVCEIEVSVNEFASICLPFAVAVEGATVYAVEGTNTTHAILTEKDDIPANEGAILAGSGTAKLTIVDNATSDWGANKLMGTTVDTYIAGDAYVLANGGNGIGMYKPLLNKDADGNEGKTHFKNNTNKAYLPIASGQALSANLRFDFGGTTGVEEVEIRNESKEIYDLTGRRVNEITKAGVYIVNGRKILVK